MNDSALLDPQAETAAAALSPDVIFDRAAVRRVELDLDYAGAVTPPEAWALVRQGAAILIDVRTAPEFKFVGRVPETVNVVWHGADPVASAAFALALRAATSEHTPLLLICRSGVRSDAAAAAATEAGFRAVYNVLEGFEGQRNQAQQRGFMDGWRKHGLPWVQD